MTVIFLGAPGAGKGTQAQAVSKRLSVPIISTGNILREAMKNETAMGQKAKEFVDAGALVPDDVIVGILNERLAMDDCLDGFILDGVPRTIAQADAISEMGIEIDKVISIEIEDEIIVKRMSGRLICPSCGMSFHIEHNPPSEEGICDGCKEKLYVRDDDREETVRERLRVYHEQTEPLKEYYRKVKKLRQVDGDVPIDDVTRNILQMLEA